MSAIERVTSAIRRHGVLGTARRLLERARYSVWFSESHVWFVLDLAAARPKPPLPEGLTLACPRRPDDELLEQLDTGRPDESRARLDAGNDLWTVLEGERVLFSCWIFRVHTPATAASGGQLRLPPDTVCLEDSVSVPAARGRGIAPAAWAKIADAVAGEEKRWIVTKVAVENVPSRRAVAKVGFVEVASMHSTRRGPRSRASLKALEDPRAALFVERLQAGLKDRVDTSSDAVSLAGSPPR